MRDLVQEGMFYMIYTAMQPNSCAAKQQTAGRSVSREEFVYITLSLFKALT